MQGPLGAGVVGHVEKRRHLNHDYAPPRLGPRRRGSIEPTILQRFAQRQRAGLHELDLVADLRGILLVVRLVLHAARNELVEPAVADATDDRDHGRLVHLRRRDGAEDGATGYRECLAPAAACGAEDDLDLVASGITIQPSPYGDFFLGAASADAGASAFVDEPCACASLPRVRVRGEE